MNVGCRQVNSQFIPGVAVGELLGLGELVAGIGIGVGLIGAKSPQVDVGSGGVVAGQYVEGIAVGQRLAVDLEAHVDRVKGEGHRAWIDSDAIGLVATSGHLGGVPLVIRHDGLVGSSVRADAVVVVIVIPVSALSESEHEIVGAGIFHRAGVGVVARRCIIGHLCRWCIVPAQTQLRSALDVERIEVDRRECVVHILAIESDGQVIGAVLAHCDGDVVLAVARIPRVVVTVDLESVIAASSQVNV